MQLRRWIQSHLSIILCLFTFFTPQQEACAMTMTLSSPAVQAGSALPAQYTCNGAGISLPLTIANVPAGAQSLALTLTDPDAPAGVWTHWVVFNLPANTTMLPENLRTMPNGAYWGLNSRGKPAYYPPCPPKGYQPTRHRYIFTLWALDILLPLEDGATHQAVQDAMHGHIIQEAQLLTYYEQP